MCRECILQFWLIQFAIVKRNKFSLFTSQKKKIKEKHVFTYVKNKTNKQRFAIINSFFHFFCRFNRFSRYKVIFIEETREKR